MKSLKKIGFGLFFAALILSFSVRLSAASMGVSHGHDLDMLWAKAQKQYDLSAHDAVLLLESRHASILENGNLLTRVHRVVWIGTEVGIGDHADLRIPWNSATSAFTVVALRTWNDGRWWPDESRVSETAVVETLPFALAQADDYTAMRETMLLHDGVELPCIMETIYEIEETSAAEEGSDGLWVFPQDDPAVLVEYMLSVPAAVTPVFRSTNGAPEPETAGDANQATTYLWKMENVDRLGSPRIAYPAVLAPHITWSTWKDWETLGRKIRSSFDGAAVLGDALADSLAERLEHEPSKTAKIRTIAGLVSEWTRGIDYDPGFWRFSPRTASRTWETAYGHALDRAVLAAALFRAGGMKAEPCISSDLGPPPFSDKIPGLSYFGRIGVLVSGMYFDPVDGSLSREQKALIRGIYWKPGKGNKFKSVLSIGGLPIGSFNLVLMLEPGEEDGWMGSGYLEAEGYLCPWDEMAGLSDEAMVYLGKVTGSVLPGASIDGYNPEHLHPSRVAVGFQLKTEAGKVDDRGRTRIAIGEPAGGIMSSLPSDVHLYDENRSSPLDYISGIVQKVSLRLKTGDREIVYLPEPYELENKAGSFALTVEMEDGWVTIDRKLHLERSIVHPKVWPLLRALLLEEGDPAHRTILLK